MFDNGSWKDAVQVNDMLMTNSLLTGFQYIRIKAAFPNFWLEQLHNHREEHAEQNRHNAQLFQIKTGDFIDPSVLKAKQFYSLVIDLHRICHPSVLHHWQAYLNLPVEFEWSTLFKFKFGNVFNNKIKEFNFKFLHRILPFKENLVRWRITSDMSCTHCKGIETVTHALLDCPEVNSFWNKVKFFIFIKFNVNVTIDEKMLFTGYKIDDKDISIPNIILTFAQYTIYRVNMLSKFTSKKLNSFSLITELKKDLNINLKFLEKKKVIILPENLLADIQAI